MSKKTKLFFVVLGIGIILFIGSFFLPKSKQLSQKNTKSIPTSKAVPSSLDSLSIEVMRARSYPGSTITIEQTLPDGSNYHQYITSYMSDGLKIYALLTVPTGNKPKNGWPIIVFNHGYIPPTTYETAPTIGQYATYLPVFASNGYVVFKPDYRGNGNSEGQPEGAYYSPAYATDDLNAIASIKKYKDPLASSGQVSKGSSPLLVDSHRLGVWGHSMGGNIALRAMVVRPSDINAAVIWGGVVGSYSQILNWHDPMYRPPPQELALRNRHRAELVQKFGTPDFNPTFWNSIDPTNYVTDISAKIQLHHGESDEEVPVTFSASLRDKLQKAGKNVEYYTYPDANHNITQGFDLAMQRSLAFFNQNLK